MGVYTDKGLPNVFIRRAPAEAAREGRDHRELVRIDGRVRGQDRAAPGANMDTTPGI